LSLRCVDSAVEGRSWAACGKPLTIASASYFWCGEPNRTMNAYDTDLYEWTTTQADALCRRAANEIDWDNIAEEIESLGRNDCRQIEHRLENLILHLNPNGNAPVGRAARSSKLGIGLRT
jgi:hypothetical protein